VTKIRRQLGFFDATMIVMGGIVGSGIFINPYVVAQQVHTPWLILGVWIAGGIVAMLGAFIYAELAARRPAHTPPAPFTSTTQASPAR
jgi:APA family basic amino acid/polyamine antiporter